MAPRWRQRPRTFAPQASVMAASVREDVGYEYTCFMHGGEDARLHERLVVDRWTSDGASSSHRHFLFRQDVWTMFRRQEIRLLESCGKMRRGNVVGAVSRSQV